MHMKRTIFAAAALVILAACNQTGADKTHSVSLPEPSHKEDAAKLMIEGERPFRSIELTESGTYIAEQTTALDGSGKPEESTKVGTFSGEKGHYKLAGLGDLAVISTRADFELNLTLPDGTVIRMQADAYGKEPLSGELAASLCRTWIPRETLIQVMGNEVPTSLGVGRVFEGCDLPGIAKYLKDSGIAITETMQGYTVKTINLTAEGTICITFDAADPYVGEWNPDMLTGQFTYQFEGDSGNALINAVGSGALSFTDADELLFVLDAKIQADKVYAAKSTITLVAAEKAK